MTLYDIALRYANEFDGGKITGGFGFSRRDRNGVDCDDSFGSVSVFFDSGFNVSLAAGSRDSGADYVYGNGAVQHIDSLNMEAYLDLRSSEFTEVATRYQNRDSVMFGVRWKF